MESASRPRLRAHGPDDSLLIDQTFSLEEVPDVATAMRTAGGWLKDTQNLEPIAVGHRVVHGGPDYDRPTQVDAKVLADLARFIPLAPLASAEQSRADPQSDGALSATAAGRLFRYGLPSRP